MTTPTLHGTAPVEALPLTRSIIMGVLNVTPDSFSDGGRWLDPAVAFGHAAAMVEDGADIIDIGAESTRPGSDPVAPDVQLSRIAPILRALKQDPRTQGVCVSVDTTSAEVAAEAIALGADMINDISGFTFDPAMLAVIAESRVAAVAMHTTGTPKVMQSVALTHDVLGAVIAFLAERLEAAEAAGIDRQRVILDPGIGFGKLGAGNLALLRGIPSLVALGRPVLIGVSRKRFIGDITGRATEDRVHGTAGAVSVARHLGAHIFRVHDVRAIRDALRVVDAINA